MVRRRALFVQAARLKCAKKIKNRRLGSREILHQSATRQKDEDDDYDRSDTLEHVRCY